MNFGPDFDDDIFWWLDDHWVICLFWWCFSILFESQPGGCWSTRPQPGASLDNCEHPAFSHNVKLGFEWIWYVSGDKHGLSIRSDPEVGPWLSELHVQKSSTGWSSSESPAAKLLRQPPGRLPATSLVLDEINFIVWPVTWSTGWVVFGWWLFIRNRSPHVLRGQKEDPGFLDPAKRWYLRFQKEDLRIYKAIDRVARLAMGNKWPLRLWKFFRIFLGGIPPARMKVYGSL